MLQHQKRNKVDVDSLGQYAAPTARVFCIERSCLLRGLPHALGPEEGACSPVSTAMDVTSLAWLWLQAAKAKPNLYAAPTAQPAEHRIMKFFLDSRDFL